MEHSERIHDGPTQEATSSEMKELSDPNQIKETLERIYDQFFLIIHQTANDTARDITARGGYFRGPLEGTALMQSPDAILSVLPELDSASPTFGTTHKGADGAVIMAFPRDIIDKQIEDGVISKVQGMRTIDDTLADLYSNNQLSEFGIPNNLIVGYYAGGKLHLNPNVNFEVPSEWYQIDYSNE